MREQVVERRCEAKSRRLDAAEPVWRRGIREGRGGGQDGGRADAGKRPKHAYHDDSEYQDRYRKIPTRTSTVGTPLAVIAADPASSPAIRQEDL